jgi:hypothetical protein
MRSRTSGASASRAFGVWIVTMLTVSIFGCAELPPAPDTYSATWKNICYGSFAGDVNDLVGPDALDCGMVQFEDGSRTQARKHACARKAVKSGQPFKFGYIALGYDSLFCDVAGRSKDGQLWSFFLDYDVTGQYGSDGRNSSLQISRCDRIEFTPGTIFAGSFFNLSECKAAPDVVKRYVH